MSTHTVLGDVDEQYTFEIDDTEPALQVSQFIGRLSLARTMMPTIPLKRVGDLVDDV